MAVTITAYGDNQIFNLEVDGSPLNWSALPIDPGSTSSKIISSVSVEDPADGTVIAVRIELTGIFSISGKSSLGQLGAGNTLTDVKLYVANQLIEQESFSSPVKLADFTSAITSLQGLEALLAGDDVFVGSETPNTFGDNDGVRGYAGNDRFIGNGSSSQFAQQFDGGSGTDTAVFAGSRSDYDVSFGNYTLYGNSAIPLYTGAGLEVKSSTSRVDYTRLFNVEQLEFADGIWAVNGTSLNFVDTEATGTLTVTGTAQVGKNLTASLVATDHNGAFTTGYQWQSKESDGTWADIPDANKAQVVDLPADEVGTVIRVVATTTDAQGGTTEFVSQEMMIASDTPVDTTAPKLSTVSPLNAASGVAIGSNLILTFDEAVQAGSGNIVIKKGKTTVATIAVTDSTQVTFSDKVVTINPSADLGYSTSYTVSMASGVITDSAGNKWAGTGSSPYSFTTVAAPNQLPTSANATATTKEDTDLVLTAANFKFIDGDNADGLKSVSITSLPAQGVLRLNGVEVKAGDSISWADIAARKLVYTPSFNGNGLAYDSLGFKVGDGKDLSASAYQLTFDVTAINDAPVIGSGATASVAENAAPSTVIYTALASDVDSGSLVYSLSGKDAAAFTIDASGLVRLKASANFEAKGSYSINVVATDSGRLSASKALTVSVTDVDEAPVAKAIAKPTSATEGKAFTYKLPAGTFADPEKAVLAYSATLADGSALPSWLTVDAGTGNLSGTPGYAAADVAVFTVKLIATDKPGNSSSTNLTIKMVNAATIAGTANVDNIVAGAGNDKLTGGKAADVLSGGAGKDTFVFAAGDSGQVTGFDQILDYSKGAVGTGDLIDHKANLVRGGVATVTGDKAAIDASTGVATFAAGSGMNMADALADVAMSLSLDGVGGKAKETAGEFAFFQVGGAGDYYLFISDGKAGLADDVVVQLVGVTGIGGIDLTSGNLTITS